MTKEEMELLFAFLKEITGLGANVAYAFLAYYIIEKIIVCSATVLVIYGGIRIVVAAVRRYNDQQHEERMR